MTGLQLELVVCLFLLSHFAFDRLGGGNDNCALLHVVDEPDEVPAVLYLVAVGTTVVLLLGYPALARRVQTMMNSVSVQV